MVDQLIYVWTLILEEKKEHEISGVISQYVESHYKSFFFFAVIATAGAADNCILSFLLLIATI